MSERTCDLMINSSPPILLLSHPRTPAWQRPQVTMDVLECPIATWPRNALLLDFSRLSGETHLSRSQVLLDLFPFLICTHKEPGSLALPGRRDHAVVAGLDLIILAHWMSLGRSHSAASFGRCPSGFSSVYAARKP